ncbi:metabolite traffic protein EboE [Agromyces binzhouensis]|uniref:Sugar phosphate isomerase/epimerase n=1 Tax=Agromyces binzhouensis TaxID=1817495 RepID=A0A4Q2JHD1_9MICO|nr:metabolite traffic protein EboE [Agromyces binzhouensis]RXZ46154.1 sugar phosphate isomerase/epimerase [Agromyces binzhouensis]
MHLSYCTNVHPAEDLDGVIAQLHAAAGPIRRAAGLDLLGVGLWLSAPLAARLANETAAPARLRAALGEEGLEVRTLNAFPYEAFHAEVVKLGVYRPDWTDPARLEYTVDAARVLAELLPPDGEGSISTLPLGWREGWDAAADRAATDALVALCAELRAIRAETGRVIRLAIEPEPGCVLDDVADTVAWLDAHRDRIDLEHVGICLDTCHLAVSFADPRTEVERIAAAGIRIVKLQASAALHVEHPGAPDARRAVAEYREDRYLHQVREQAASGPIRVDDLPEALEALPASAPWRVHFHVPLHLEPEPPLRATTEVLEAALDAVVAVQPVDQLHVDVETYTWSVLPGVDADHPVDLVDGVAGELRWAAARLAERQGQPA